MNTFLNLKLLLFFPQSELHNSPTKALPSDDFSTALSSSPPVTGAEGEQQSVFYFAYTFMNPTWPFSASISW